MRKQQRTNEREKLKRYKPFTDWEKQVIEKTPDDDLAISIILRHRKYLREHKQYISSIERMQYGEDLDEIAQRLPNDIKIASYQNASQMPELTEFYKNNKGE